MEQIDYNLLFRWFVGLPIDAAIWHPTVFSHNRDRLMAADVAQEFLGALMGLAQVKALLSSEHFSVDGTLIDAWASMKSFQPGPAPDLIRGTGRGRRKAPDAMASATFMARSARTRPMPAPPTPMRGFTRRRTASRAGFATWVMC
jgi:hypothetical protein